MLIFTTNRMGEYVTSVILTPDGGKLFQKLLILCIYFFFFYTKQSLELTQKVQQTKELCEKVMWM